MSDYIKKGGVTEDGRSIAIQEAQLKLKFRTLLDRIANNYAIGLSTYKLIQEDEDPRIQDRKAAQRKELSLQSGVMMLAATSTVQSACVYESEYKQFIPTLEYALDRITKASNRICHIRAQIYTTLDLPCN